MDPKLSIIITTKNEEKNILNLLKSIKNQTFKSYEVIVVDNNSSDNTKIIAKQFGAKVFNLGPERSAQRNFGVSNALGKYVLILDADMILEKEILSELYSFAEKNPYYKCLVMKEEPVGDSIWAKAKKLELEFYTQPKDFDLAPRWFNKEIFIEFKGFDENQTGTEDWDIADRIYSKYPYKYLSKQRVFHNEGDYGLVRILKKKFYYASKSHNFVKKSRKGVFNPRFIYFLRPQFYYYWKLWLRNIPISLSLILLLTLQIFVSAVSFIYTQFINKK
jgi:glycosyltransferase involved in cell wall biosynthesis